MRLTLNQIAATIGDHHNGGSGLRPQRKLDDAVQHTQRHRLRHEDAAPDRRADSQQTNLELQDRPQLRCRLHGLHDQNYAVPVNPSRLTPQNLVLPKVAAPRSLVEPMNVPGQRVESRRRCDLRARFLLRRPPQKKGNHFSP